MTSFRERSIAKFSGCFDNFLTDSIDVTMKDNIEEKCSSLVDVTEAVPQLQTTTGMYHGLNITLNPIRTGGGGGEADSAMRRHIFLDFSKLRSSQGLKLGEF